MRDVVVVVETGLRRIILERIIGDTRDEWLVVVGNSYSGPPLDIHRSYNSMSPSATALQSPISSSATISSVYVVIQLVFRLLHRASLACSLWVTDSTQRTTSTLSQSSRVRKRILQDQPDPKLGSVLSWGRVLLFASWVLLPPAQPRKSGARQIILHITTTLRYVKKLRSLSIGNIGPS